MTDRFRPDYPDVPSMNQAVREYQRQRQMGIGDLLLENRIVFLDGVITDGAAN